MNDAQLKLLMAEGEGLTVEFKVTEKVTENQKLILAGISANPAISAVTLAHSVGISARKIKENIKKLKEKELLRRIGPDKGGHWEVKRGYDPK